MTAVQRIRDLLGRPPEEPHPLLEVTWAEDQPLDVMARASTTTPPFRCRRRQANLEPDHPQLMELRRAYAGLDLPVTIPSRWNDGAVGSFLDLRWVRGETLFVWHYRERPRISSLKYFVYTRYVRDNDGLGLLDRLEEDGLFGCWSFTYPGWGTVSRDLLQSVNEINFLDRALNLSRLPSVRVLDIGAGYGRLAHRMTAALTNLTDYCCVDVVPEATFLSDWYLRYRGCAPAGSGRSTRSTPGGRAAERIHAGREHAQLLERPLLARGSAGGLIGWPNSMFPTSSSSRTSPMPC